MSDTFALAAAMFPHITATVADWEARFPERSLPEGARVTRFAPSPTGYLHFGALYTATVNWLTAKATKGVFYFRLEDTDKKREVDGGTDDMLTGLLCYGVVPDEGFIAPGRVEGDYGPYQQSCRAEIYQTYAKWLVEQGLAYPCFCSEEERNAVREEQTEKKVRTGYYGEYAPCRDLTPDEAIARIQSGATFVTRLRSPGSEERRVKYDDMIKGTIEMPENDEDFVLLKSDGIPTYHFAHAIDDHLMHTTHVIRSDEWLPSVPKHLQLFKLLGFKTPKYAHIGPIMKEDNGGKRKLSKRKDPEAAVHFYTEQGFPTDSLPEYLMTIVNSDFEEWRRREPDAPRTAFPFNLKKMSVSGALFDMAKLNDISKNVIARMDAASVLDGVLSWAAEYAPDYYALLNADRNYALRLFGIDRGGAKPRKDLAKWSDAPDYTAYFFDETFDGGFELPENVAHADAAALLTAYKAVYDECEDKDAWFARVKTVCEPCGFCPDVKAYKADPTGWKGHVGDVSTIIRLAVTGRRNTPDLCSIMQLLGRDRVTARIDAAIAKCH